MIIDVQNKLYITFGSALIRKKILRVKKFCVGDIIRFNILLHIKTNPNVIQKNIEIYYYIILSYYLKAFTFDIM